MNQLVLPAETKRNRVISAPLPKSPANDAWTEQAEKYLTSNGWETTGRNEYGVARWRDPLTAGGPRGVLTQIGVLPQREGPDKPLMQLVVPPARWDRNTEDAVGIQRKRDEHADPDAAERTPLGRVDHLGQLVSRMLGHEVRVAEDLLALLKRGVPEKAENLKVELLALRRAILANANALKTGVDKAAQTAA